VARSVAGAALGEAGGVDHVHPLGLEQLDHPRRGRRVVGVVAVGQHVHVGLDVGEHPANDVALALQRLAAHHRAGLRRPGGGAVGGVVVVDVDGRAGQRGTEVAHDLADGDGLVEAGQQHGDARGRAPCGRRGAGRRNVAVGRLHRLPE